MSKSRDRILRTLAENAVAERARRDDLAEKWANAIAGMNMLRDGLLLLPNDFPGKTQLLRSIVSRRQEVSAWYDGIKNEVLGVEGLPKTEVEAPTPHEQPGAGPQSYGRGAPFSVGMK